MEAAAATAPPAGGALDARARTGDREAFNALNAPHFAGVYDYVLRVVRDRDLAAAAVRATFARAWHDSAELVARRGRHNCTELDILLSAADAQYVSQHVHRCARCHESKRRFVSPAEVLKALTAMAPTRKLRHEIFGGRRRRRRLFGIL